MSPALFFFFRIALAVLDLLWFHMNFRINCSSSVANYYYFTEVTLFLIFLLRIKMIPSRIPCN